ncbi:hypothetical protein CB1_000844021 [Camelus ferus]|nr:hypothetical protein CB1_000844021 [Camelus ferus]
MFRLVLLLGEVLTAPVREAQVISDPVLEKILLSVESSDVCLALYPVECLHLIHWNATLFSSIDEAVGKTHGIAIIALFVQRSDVDSSELRSDKRRRKREQTPTIGKEHVGLKAVTEILQDIQYKGKSKIIPCFNPNTLLPDPLLRDYWVYEGSLTVPPCSEGVTWILFRYPLTISQLQWEAGLLASDLNVSAMKVKTLLKVGFGKFTCIRSIDPYLDVSSYQGNTET